MVRRERRAERTRRIHSPLGTHARCSGVSTPLATTLGQPVRYRHDRLDDDDIVGIVRDVAHEGLVDLDAVEREALEITQARIAGCQKSSMVSWTPSASISSRTCAARNVSWMMLDTVCRGR